MIVADLMADLARLGIRLEAAGDRLRYSPREGLAPELLADLRKHKAELLAMLAGEHPEAEPPAPEHQTWRCRCGSTAWRDVAIHGGQSTRRDCGRCGRFIGFAVWQGREQGRRECFQSPPLETRVTSG
jgi:hypothetical protein